MKKILCCLLILSLYGPIAKADAPSAYLVNYDIDYHYLVLTIKHPVLDPTNHYISNVTIYLNGDEVYSRDFDSQTDRDSLSVPPVNMNAEIGDAIKIVATSSEGGSSSFTYKVQGPYLN